MKKPENKTESVGKSIEVTRAKQFDNGGVVFDVVINDVTIYGCRVIEYKGGDFVSFPSRKGSDDKYYNHVYVKLTDEDSKEIISQVEKKLEE